jgi:hypothetical protein
MNRPNPRWQVTSWILSLGFVATLFNACADALPGRTWTHAAPADVGLDPIRLAAFTGFVGGRGVVARHGFLAHGWGDISRRGDVASACKPVFAHFLFRALADQKIPSLDEPALRWEPRLTDLNADLGFKDRAITWRHFATQTSCYGLAETPGTAFAYNDWQMALFADLLFNRVYATPWPEVDAKILGPLLTQRIHCEDSPSFSEFGGGKNPGRLSISPRDFARLGLLYLNLGRWNHEFLLPPEFVRMATRSPLPASLPRAGTRAAPMLAEQRSLGSRKVPDNQTEHFGSYSFLWWVNGIDANGHRHWPDAPIDTYAALGHGGKRALWIVPSLDLIVSWNDTVVESPAQENEALRLLLTAVSPPSAPPPSANTPKTSTSPSSHPDRLRVLIETDAGGDPDDEQSLVRFLLYANEWDVEGLIANRPTARNGENQNPERTGLDIVRRQLDAYAACWPLLSQHDPRYPAPETLRARTVAGYNDTDAAVQLIIAAVDRPDPRPIWYSDWGSDRGAATNNLRRALDRVLRERGPQGYATFKQRLRLASSDAFGPHTTEIAPPFPLWVDTWRPERDGRRWYHRFSALTSNAGGFDVVRDLLNQGPLGALYPTNTTHWCKEGDSLSFLYLVPNGLNAPEHPAWGGWGGRLKPRPGPAHHPYFWSDQTDVWNGSTNRDNTLLRWAADLQNDFRARLRWCVTPTHAANHPPLVRIEPTPPPTAIGGTLLHLTTRASSDPDHHTLQTEWIHYREPGTWKGEVTFETNGADLLVTLPKVRSPETLHFIARVTDNGAPPLTRYQRVVVTVLPPPRQQPSPPAAHGDALSMNRASVAAGVSPAVEGGVSPPGIPNSKPVSSSFLNSGLPWTPPPEFAGDLGTFRRLLRFEDGRPVTTPALWAERRQELLRLWHTAMGAWPPLLERPALEVLARQRQPGETFERRRVRLEIARGQTGEGWLLVPDRPGPLPAVLVPFYEPETSIGQGRPLRDFGLQLARRGFVTLSIGSPGGDARRPDLGTATCQPLSFLAYVAANAATALAQLPEVDPDRLGIVGHSYGGKWALFAACLDDRFAAAAWSDPGIVWDERRSNVNYWDVWYLGRTPESERRPGIPTPDNPATGAYKALVDAGHDLHELQALMAPRPFLVSGGAEDPAERWKALNHVIGVNQLLGRTHGVAMTLRPTHDPTEASNAQLYEFFEHTLEP